jgi:NAD(P)-dependent dehydrogenase (short-subunit alcohol dehydrogenase family)
LLSLAPRPASAARPRYGWRLHQVAAEIEAAGGHALPVVGDVMSERDMAELVRLSLERYQRLDVVICNGFGVAGAVRAIDHPVPEVYPYALSRGLVWLNALAPGICDRLVRKYGRKPAGSDHDPRRAR